MGPAVVSCCNGSSSDRLCPPAEFPLPGVQYPPRPCHHAPANRNTNSRFVNANEVDAGVQMTWNFQLPGEWTRNNAGKWGRKISRMERGVRGQRSPFLSHTRYRRSRRKKSINFHGGSSRWKLERREGRSCSYGAHGVANILRENHARWSSVEGKKGIRERVARRKPRPPGKKFAVHVFHATLHTHHQFSVSPLTFHNHYRFSWGFRRSPNERVTDVHNFFSVLWPAPDSLSCPVACFCFLIDERPRLVPRFPSRNLALEKRSPLPAHRDIFSSLLPCQTVSDEVTSCSNCQRRV